MLWLDDSDGWEHTINQMKQSSRSYKTYVNSAIEIYGKSISEKRNNQWWSKDRSIKD